MRPPLLAALAGLGALAAAAASSSCYPQDVDPMKVQPKAMPYRESAFFGDGRDLRPPVPGTVPRERRLGTSELVEGRTASGAAVERIPVPLTREAVEKGRAHFEVLCATCHGLLGTGDSVVARKMSLRPPPSLHDFRDKPPGFFYGVVTRGFGFMPSYADLLDVEQRWQVVAYVQALQLSQSMPLQSVPPDQQRKLQEEPP
ncbi:MAG TPA: cytochrome c [Myxococcales bacterium]|jgi:mono/diheme cytochrome c family protein